MTASTLGAGVAGIGLLGPGLVDWTSAAALLRDPTLWHATPTVVPAPMRLPANERRRAGTAVKASMGVADQACLMADLDPAVLATVFTASSGDPDNCHALCEALAMAERVVSPTRFTNSVHNAGAGYWHIAVRSQRPSTSLAVYDGCVAAGLLEAMAQCAFTQRAVLLVACDLPYPAPLHALRPLRNVFAFALLLVPAGQAALARLTLRLTGNEPATTCTHAALERLRLGNPAARALPLLQALAGAGAQAVCIEAQTGSGVRVNLALTA